MKKRHLYLIFMFALLSIILLSSSCSREKRDESAVRSMESSITLNGTSAGRGISEVKDKMASGQSTVNITTVLKEKNNYVCALNSSRGVLSLEFKQGKIREDAIVGSTNETVYIIGNNAYKYHPYYKEWMKIDYSPDIELSKKQFMTSFLSESELLSMDSSRIFCVRSDVDDSEFDIPTDKAYDVKEILAKLGFDYK